MPGSYRATNSNHFKFAVNAHLMCILFHTPKGYTAEKLLISHKQIQNAGVKIYFEFTV